MEQTKPTRLIVGITGATETIFGVRILQMLHGSGVDGPRREVQRRTLLGVVFNFSLVLSGLLFLVLALTMLLHRLFWPAIDRPLYKLQALGIAKRPRVFAALGLTLIGVGWKAEWLKGIVDKLF